MAGQTDLSRAKMAMTRAEALESPRLHRVAGRTGEDMAFVARGSAPHAFVDGRDRVYAMADDPWALTAGD